MKMNVKSTCGFFLAAAVTGLLMSGCYSPSRSRKKVFRYNEYNGIASLDPAFAKSQSTMWPAHQLFNTLVEVDDSLHIVPSIAKSWDISADRTLFTFHLRTDVFFHDDACFAESRGRKLSAKECGI